MLDKIHVKEFYRRRRNENLVNEQDGDILASMAGGMGNSNAPAGNAPPDPNISALGNAPLPQETPGAEVEGEPLGNDKGNAQEQEPQPAEQQPPKGNDKEQLPEEERELSFSEKMIEYLNMVEKSSVSKEEMREYLDAMSKEAITAAERAFVDNNLSALSLLEETVIEDIRKKLKKEKEFEGLSKALIEALDSYKEMSEALQRLSVAGPDKSNLLRQLVAATCGGVIIPGVVGGEVHCPRGKDADTIILRPIATLNWGYVDLGPTRITENSPADYLSEENRKKILNGAPEERRVLRNRVFIESVSDQLGGANYLILSLPQDEEKWGLAYFDSNLFRQAYEEGNITVLEATPGLSGSLAVNAQGEWVAMTTWRMARVDNESVGFDMETGVKNPKHIIIGELQGERFIWVGDGTDIKKCGGNYDEVSFRHAGGEEAQKIKLSVPDARERLMGRRS